MNKKLAMSTWALVTVRRVVSDLSMYEDGRVVPPDILDAFIMSLELVYREMIAQDCVAVEGLNEAERESCSLIRSALCILKDIAESEQMSLATTQSGCENHHYYTLDELEDPDLKSLLCN